MTLVDLLVWVLRLFFPALIPTTLLLPGYLAYFPALIPTTLLLPGYLAYFSCSIPTTLLLPGYLAYFSCSIPTTLLLPGYLAYFSCSHTHYSALGWVSRLLLLLHTHDDLLAWVSRLLFLLSYPLLCSCLGITLISPAPYPRRPTKTNIQNKEKGMYAKIKHTYPVYKKVNTKLYSILFLSQLVSYI